MATLSRVTLLSLSLLGAATLHGISTKSGFYHLIESYKKKSVFGDGTLYNGKITTVAPIDDFVGVLIQFFWPCVDGNDPGLSLLSFLFGGQATSFVVISLLDALRAGNKGKLVSYLSLYGILYQTVGLAVIAPLYLFLYSLTSPTLLDPSLSNLTVDSGLLSGIPFAITVGFIAPSVAMSLPSPSLLSADAKVKAIAFWQLAPVYTVILTSVWKLLSGSSSATPNPKTQLQRLRTVYKYGLAIAVPAHIATATLTLTSLVFPQIYTPAISQALHPLSAIIPGNPLTLWSTPTTSLAQGASNFLQWDYLISSSAYLVYALTARFASKVEPKGFSAADVGGLLVRYTVLGPFGTAASYLWERDEIVFGREEGTKKLK